MFLLLALIVQIVQIHGQQGWDCHFLTGRNRDYGNDYKRWEYNVRSLSECQRKCESSSDWCRGITWVKDSSRNCALYDSYGVEEGVGRRNQDSYECRGCPPCPNLRADEYCVCPAASGGVLTRWGSSTAATSAVSNSGRFGHGGGGSCPHWKQCRTGPNRYSRSGQCCFPPPGKGCESVRRSC